MSLSTICGTGDYAARYALLLTGNGIFFFVCRIFAEFQAWEFLNRGLQTARTTRLQYTSTYVPSFVAAPDRTARSPLAGHVDALQYQQPDRGRGLERLHAGASGARGHATAHADRREHLKWRTSSESARILRPHERTCVRTPCRMMTTDDVLGACSTTRPDRALDRCLSPYSSTAHSVQAASLTNS